MGGERRQALVDALRHPRSEMHEELRRLKKWGISESKRPDFVWHILLQSFATWGGSRGAEGLINNPDNYDRVTFDRLSMLGPKRRHEAIQRTFRRAGIRYAEKKALLMIRNYELVAEMGGPEGAKKKALAQDGREVKIAFMKRFHGIGDKYARSIWMDVYHPDFRNTIAVDQRIKKVTRALGYAFATYEEEERFYQQIAEEAGLEGWELDRLLYSYTDQFLTVISQARTERSAGCEGSFRAEPEVTEVNTFGLTNEEDKKTFADARHLIRGYLDARDGLKRLGILRTGRTLQGDYAEWLVARLLSLELSETSVQKGIDAKDYQDRTYQIKSRIVANLSSPTSFDLSDPGFRFDFLVAVFFDPQLGVLGVLRVPYDVVMELGSQTRTTFRLYWRGASTLADRMERLFWSGSTT